MFALRGKRSGSDRITHWRLEASNNTLIWVTLYSATNIILDNRTQFFAPTSSLLAMYYKITIIATEGDNPGLSYFQLFTYDKLETPYLSEIATD